MRERFSGRYSGNARGEGEEGGGRLGMIESRCLLPDGIEFRDSQNRITDRKALKGMDRVRLWGEML